MEFNHGGSTRGSKRPRDSEEGRRLGDHHPATKQSKASGKYMTNKIGQIVSTTSGPNDGYDDSEKFYINRMHDHISYRYELLESLGKGDTSQVFKALDHKTAVVFELLARNLSRLKFETCYKGFTPLQVKKFIIPVLQCLQGLSQKQIVHGDLNLENILLKQEYRDEIKGCAYRAPELILGIEYGTPVDMWAVGCVVVELFTGQKLLPERMSRIKWHVFWSCSENLRRIIYRRRHELRKEGKWEDKRTSGTRDLELVLGMDRAVKPTFLDFVKRCLEWVPEARLKPSQALVHPWIKKMRSKSQTKNGNEGGGGGVAGNVAA
ncbi:Dual specificity tyrosine-phosphorylation-regulated kinase 2 [Orchesella cincta]|uniref:Dual specificity tyrosine-phosphorylation-regulated kinase 2 n=1 Tax=Orchesella cincta TaxID=48709 RepID=A0A1D2M973_ORCCI|nr:Dual specificity tyrosine-phosphorylation-regulated kinase 2 [Orchesella cincta]